LFEYLENPKKYIKVRCRKHFCFGMEFLSSICFLFRWVSLLELDKWFARRLSDQQCKGGENTTQCFPSFSIGVPCADCNFQLYSYFKGEHFLDHSTIFSNIHPLLFLL
jgi:hypothetical protein